jgi:hypothetical protein
MFNKKIDRELESIRRHLDQVENEIKHEIKQLKCEHKNLEFLTEATYPRGNSFALFNQMVKVCNDCSKVLKVYDTHEEYLTDKLDYLDKEKKESSKSVRNSLYFEN